MVDISQLMTYWTPSWIVSYSRNCYVPSRYEHLLQKMPSLSPHRPAWRGECSPRHRQLLHPLNMLDDHTYVHIIQWDTCLYNIQDLEPEDITERMRIKKKQANKRRVKRIRHAAEIQAGKVKQLRRELQIAHKRSRTEDGELGIVWWNREYWGTGFWVKRLGIKKEEPLTPP